MTWFALVKFLKREEVSYLLERVGRESRRSKMKKRLEKKILQSSRRFVRGVEQHDLLLGLGLVVLEICDVPQNVRRIAVNGVRADPFLRRS